MGNKSSTISPSNYESRTLFLIAGYARKKKRIPHDMVDLISRFYQDRSSMFIAKEYMYRYNQEICRISDSSNCIMSAVNLKRLNENERLYVDEQLRMMTSMTNGHPNILKTYDVFYHESCAALLIMHELAKIPLEALIIFYEGLDEDDAKWIFHQLLSGIEYLHRHDIVHGNISASSCFVDSFEFGSESDGNLKLMMTNRGHKGRKNTFDLQGKGVSVVPSGLPLILLPPESWNKGTHTKAADMWYAGILLYTMLDGKEPWGREDRRVRGPRQLIKRERYGSMESGFWNFVTDEAKDLVRQLLNRDPNRRFSVTQALSHDWFDGMSD